MHQGKQQRTDRNRQRDTVRSEIPIYHAAKQQLLTEGRRKRYGNKQCDRLRVCAAGVRSRHIRGVSDERHEPGVNLCRRRNGSQSCQNEQGKGCRHPNVKADRLALTPV